MDWQHYLFICKQACYVVCEAVFVKQLAFGPQELLEWRKHTRERCLLIYECVGEVWNTYVSDTVYQITTYFTLYLIFLSESTVAVQNGPVWGWWVIWLSCTRPRWSRVRGSGSFPEAWWVTHWPEFHLTNHRGKEKKQRYENETSFTINIRECLNCVRALGVPQPHPPHIFPPNLDEFFNYLQTWLKDWFINRAMLSRIEYCPHVNPYWILSMYCINSPGRTCTDECISACLAALVPEVFYPYIFTMGI